MATADALHGEPQAFDGAVLAQRFDSVLRAGGREAARGRRVGRNALLIEADGQNQAVREKDG